MQRQERETKLTRNIPNVIASITQRITQNNPPPMEYFCVYADLILCIVHNMTPQFWAHHPNIRCNPVRRRDLTGYAISAIMAVTTAARPGGSARRYPL